MNGLALARAFYNSCRPVLMEAVPDIMAYAAVGLVGEGSECLGCDDIFSQDHDFGPAFCIWLPRTIMVSCQERLETALDLLPHEFAGLPSRILPHRRHQRVGPLVLEDFYTFFTGLDHPPSTWQEWLSIPEYQLAACTNGEVFEDNNGKFSSWRQQLQAFYPRDVWLKMLATRCMRMAQAGQYNLPRCLARGDGVAAMLSTAHFAEAALSLVFLLNRRYMPFYKWAGMLVRRLPLLGTELANALDALAAAPLRGSQDMLAAQIVEDFCIATVRHLHTSGLSDRREAWLWLHGPAILQHVETEALQCLDLLRD